MANSENYIKNSIKRKFEEIDPKDVGTFFIVPDIKSSQLVNSSNKIAGGIDSNSIIAIFDSSLFSNGKEGIVFTGTKIYIKEMLSPRKEIPLDDIVDVSYDTQEYTDKNGDIKQKPIMTVKYSDETVVTVSNTECSKHLDFLADLLRGIIENVDVIEENKQMVQLDQLGDSIIESYIDIITAYLKADDGIIDSKEYKSLISLMARLKVSKELSEKLREKRLDTDAEDADFLVLTQKLDKELEKARVDYVSIHQSLFNDLLYLRENSVDNWENDKDLMLIASELSISKEQINVLVHKIKMDKKIISERLQDNQIKEATKEFTAIAAGAGVTLAALAVTGGVSTGIGGGLIALGSLSTGGLVLGLAAIGGLSYGAYKGIKYFSGTSELEKSGIRVNTLLNAIENNKRSTTYIIDDVNWLTNKMTQLLEKINQSSELDNDLMDQLMMYMDFSSNVGQAGEIVEANSSKAEYEINIAKLPKNLDIGKFNELVKLDKNRVQITELVMSIYTEGTKTDVAGTSKTVYERPDELEYEEAENLVNVLTQIGFFDTTRSVLAQGKSLSQKGLNVVRDFFG